MFGGEVGWCVGLLTEAQSQRDVLRAQLASRQYLNEELV